MHFTGRALIFVIALALVAAACGDDDAATTTTTTVAPGTTTASTAAPATTATTTEGTDEEDSGAIDELLALYEMTPVRVTYLIGEGDNQTEIVLSQDPTAEPPVESITIAEANSKIIITEGMTVFCDGASNMCFEVPGAGGESMMAGFLGPIGSIFATAESGGPLADADITVEPTTVAGRDGVCFSYEPPPSLGVEYDLVRQCIDNEFGFTLLVQSSDTTDGTVETIMELIDFSQPTPEDFEPTGPVTAQD